MSDSEQIGGALMAISLFVASIIMILQIISRNVWLGAIAVFMLMLALYGILVALKDCKNNTRS